MKRNNVRCRYFSNCNLSILLSFFIYKAINKYIKNREKYNCIVGIFNIVKIKLLKKVFLWWRASFYDGS